MFWPQNAENRKMFYARNAENRKMLAMGSNRQLGPERPAEPFA